VVEDCDGSAVKNLIRANTERFDVLLLDVTLPGLSSREVFEETRRIRPDLKIVLTGAYGKEIWHPKKYKEQVLCRPLLC